MKEILNGKEWEFPLFLKRILVIFNEITKEENCPLERAISRLEFNNKEEVMPENLSSNLAKIFKLYQEFSGMVDFKENAKINLYSLHRIPFSKVFFLIISLNFLYFSYKGVIFETFEKYHEESRTYKRSSNVNFIERI